jgi:peptidoglycan/LPS O-acetylase OafA/YrhL
MLSDDYHYFSASTSFLIYLAIKLKRYDIWLTSCFFQFFGLISYSLYLTHCLIGNKIIRLLKSVLEWEPQDTLVSHCILMLSFVISTIFAYFFYSLIEKRSIGWSHKISSLIKCKYESGYYRRGRIYWISIGV